MYRVFVENGYGSSGVDAVNREFGTSLKYDGLRRRFRKFGMDPRKPAATYEWNGHMYTIRQLAEISSLS